MRRFREPDVGHEFRMTLELEETGTRRPRRARVTGRLLAIEPSAYRFAVSGEWLDEDSRRPWSEDLPPPASGGGMLFTEQQILSADAI